MRKILGIKTTYIDRGNTNKKVFELSNAQVNPRNKPNKNIRPFSEYVQTKQNALLAHIIRSDVGDPMRDSSLMTHSDMPVDFIRRRVGRPRHNWTWETYRKLYITNNMGTLDMFKADPPGSVTRVANRARNRTLKC